jgi:hypothetical protein
MNYKPKQKDEQGQIFCYRPYPPEAVRRARMSTFSIVLRCILAAVVLAAVVIIAVQAGAEDVTRWVLCRPGDYINLRLEPSKDSMSVGYLECGDEFQTDGTTRNGWIRVLNAGECECWIYSGYVAEVQPEYTGGGWYTVTARRQVAARRWVDGPKVARRPWLKCGAEVRVYCIAGKWAVTNRGYVQSEWLEGDPV